MEDFPHSCFINLAFRYIEYWKSKICLMSALGHRFWSPEMFFITVYRFFHKSMKQGNQAKVFKIEHNFTLY